MFNKLNIMALYIFWAAFVINLFVPFGGDVEQGVLYIGLGLLVVHFIEFLLIFNKLKGINRTAPEDFIKVMLIGLFHWLPLLRKAG